MNNMCLACGQSELEIIWELPNLPLTGIYVANSSDFTFQNEYDQNLLFCNNCGHGQLANLIDPKFLYMETYTHRTSDSVISASGNSFLLQYINERILKKTPGSILEIGCNDLFLLKNIDSPGVKLSGVDPIWPEGVVQNVDGITLLGGFAENIDYSLILEEPLDLVISAHTFEHITDPRKALEQLSPFMAPNSTFIIEIPSAERMLEQVRLDQVFSQHVNYYSVSSLIHLFQSFGMGLKSLTYNYKYWGGTQILEFELGYHSEISFKSSKQLRLDYQSAISLFVESMKVTAHQISNSVGEVYCFGAAQMLPVLSYHLGQSFNKIVGIIDDNPSRQNLYFPHLKQEILPSSVVNNWEAVNIVVTALDSARPILRRLLDLGPRSIILPVGNF